MHVELYFMMPDKVCVSNQHIGYFQPMDSETTRAVNGNYLESRLTFQRNCQNCYFYDCNVSKINYNQPSINAGNL